MSKVTFINHSSILFSLGKNNKIFLTDFWFQSPAFGSWLPSAPPIYHPNYLASLSFQKNFYLVISHAHDDHIDDNYLKNYFNINTKVIINKFSGPSLLKRIQRLGFKNIIQVDSKGVTIEDVKILSIHNKKISNDDAALILKDKKYCVYHGNDNWFKLEKDNVKRIKSFANKRKFLFASQTNSASGFPITYPQFKKDKTKELKNKVKKMLLTGLENCKKVKADYFLPYAGYSTPYVNNFNYNNELFHPTYRNLKKLLPMKNKKLLNIFCGGTIDLESGKISYPFNFDPKDLINITDKYYKNEKIIDSCDTYKKDFIKKKTNKQELKRYMNLFNKFVSSYMERFPNFYSSVIGKTLRFSISDKEKILFSHSIKIGSKSLFNGTRCNKEFIISSNLFKLVIDKKITFENLYTGYESIIKRHPKNIYNRDIIIYLIMFGYKFYNS
tara:strand:- start:2005 stop:3330 length:1326 start_codon:yes stop_codon:yes gene_type:complete